MRVTQARAVPGAAHRWDTLHRQRQEGGARRQEDPGRSTGGRPPT